MRERKFTWLVWTVVLLAAFFRLYQLPQTPPGLYPDEAMNGNNAVEAWRTGEFKVYYPENNGREGLFINIQALFLAAIGQYEPWVLRLPAAIFGILTVLGLYFLGRELFSKRVGWLAAFFMATSVWHIIFSRIGFRAVMAPLFLTWALFFFLRAMRESGEREAEGGAGTNSAFPNRFSLLAALGGVFFGLGFYTYIAFRVMPLLFAVFLPFYFRRAEFWRTAIIFLGATILVALPIGVYYLQNPADFLGRTSQISIFSSETPLRDLALNIGKTLAMFSFAGDYNWRHNLAGRPQLFWPVGLLLIWGVLTGIKRLGGRASAAFSAAGENNSEYENWESARNLKLSFALLFVWLGLAFLPVVISAEGLPHALRAILMIPPVLLLAAAGAVSAYSAIRRHWRRLPLRPFVYAFLILLVLEAYQTYFILWAKSPHTAGAFSADYVMIGRQINELAPATSKYVVVHAGGVAVRGLPMPTQTVMFLTDSFDPARREEQNIHYIAPVEADRLPENAIKFRLR